MADDPGGSARRIAELLERCACRALQGGGVPPRRRRHPRPSRRRAAGARRRGPAQGPARHRRQHGPRHRAGARRRGPRVPRPARGRGGARRRRRARRSAPRCAATSTSTPTGPTAAPRSRRWRARPSSSATSTSRSPTTRPSCSVAHGLDADRLREQLDVVARAERGARAVPHPHRHRGRHPRGRRPRPGAPTCSSRLDVVVASVHSKLRMDAEPMTERMVTALASPHVDILGHCTGRIVLGKGRPESEFDAELVFAAAAHLDKAVEINCRPGAARPADAAAPARGRRGVQGVDRLRRPRRRPARVAALRLRTAPPRRACRWSGSSTPGPPRSSSPGRPRTRRERSRDQS